MKDDKLCISPDALIAMIVTEAQDRALAQMPGPEAPLGEVQASDTFLRRMDALVHTANRRANRQYGRLAIKRFLVALATALSLFSCTMLPVKAVREAVVETLLEWHDTLRIDNERALKSYLYIVTRERSIDFLRKWERRGTRPDYESLAAALDHYVEPEEVALTNLQLDRAIALLEEIPLIYRQTLVLRVKGYSIREIAKITDSSEPNVRTRIHRARAMLLRSFAEQAE